MPSQSSRRAATLLTQSTIPPSSIVTMEATESATSTATAPAVAEKPQGPSRARMTGVTGPKRRRQRAPGKRTVKSCAACRAAHVRCVADRYGVPCERCAKKSWLDVSTDGIYRPRWETTCAVEVCVDPISPQCTLIRVPPKHVSVAPVGAAAKVDGDGVDDTDIDPLSPQGRMLRQMASDGLVLVVKEMKRASPCPVS